MSVWNLGESRNLDAKFESCSPFQGHKKPPQRIICSEQKGHLRLLAKTKACMEIIVAVRSKCQVSIANCPCFQDAPLSPRNRSILMVLNTPEGDGTRKGVAK